MIYDPWILNSSRDYVLWKVAEYDTPDRPYWFQFFIHKLFEEEAHIIGLLSPRKMDTQLFRKYQDLR